MPKSLQGRLLLAVLGLLVLAWAGTAVLIWRDARVQLDDLLDGHLAQAAALVVAQQGHEMEEDELDLDAPDLHLLAPKVAFQVWHAGELVMRSANAPRTAFFAPNDPPVAGFRNVSVDDVRWRVFTTRGAVHDDHAMQVYVAERIDSRQSILLAVLRGMLWPALLVLPLMAVAIAWSVHCFVAPLRALQRQLAIRAPSAEEALAVSGAPSELVPAVHALNDLFARTASLLSAERRFTADAAHELRTPIATIRAQAQVAMAEPEDAQRQRALAATVQACDRAAHLVEQLLTLSRLESEALPSARRVDLVPLVRAVLADIAPRAVEQDQAVELEAPEHAQVRGDATLLGVLVRNLADNAIRYSPPGATIQVRVEDSPKGVHLRVEDSGPGMQEAELMRIGERFFRVLGSGQDGSGLGWSIVQRVATVHHARLHVQRSSALGGLCVEVAWPPLPT